MSAVMIDSNVLLDLVTEDSTWLTWSEAAIMEAAENARLVINPIIFAEVSVGYARVEDMEAALPIDLLEREALPYAAAFLAGKAFAAYRRRGGQKRGVENDQFGSWHGRLQRSRKGQGVLRRFAGIGRGCSHVRTPFRGPRLWEAGDHLLRGARPL
jgi:predicted nucleic acid-binding protein